jgi:hypothetical protein
VLTRWHRGIALSLVPAAFFVWVGLAGLDFGFHWDEDNMLQRVRHAAETGVLLPGMYNYPSVTFWLTTAGLLADLPAAQSAQGSRLTPASSTLTDAIAAPRFRFRARAIFVWVTALSIVATAALSLALGASATEALVAASLLATSWEVGYHARWIAPDDVMMMFATFATATALCAYVWPARTTAMLRLAAVFAGLAIGTKYTAWPLLLTLTAAVIVTGEPRPRTAVAAHIARLVGLAALVYLATTPGTVLQPGPFVRGVQLELVHYATGHGRHTVAPGIDHLSKILAYLGGALPSPYRILALALTALAALGALTLIRNTARAGLVLLVFPVVYLLWFSTERVMIVRNLLVIAPVLAVLSARGAATLWTTVDGSVRWRGLRWSVPAFIVIAVGAAAAFELSAAESIRGRGASPLVDAFASWTAEHPGRRVTLSRRLEADLGAAGLTAQAGAGVESPSVAFYASEQDELGDIDSNRPGTFEAVLGDQDANFDYYTDWAGSEHILVLSAATAERLRYRVR